MGKNITWGVVFIFFLLSCGRDPSKRKTQNAPPTTPEILNIKNNHKLLIFGAPWCVNCPKEFIEISNGLSKEIASDKNFVVNLYITEGEVKGSKPSPESIVAYQKKLGEPPFKYTQDEWPWKAYRKWIRNTTPWQIPAGVLLNEKDEVVKKYLPGDFLGPVVVESVKNLLKP